MILINPKKQYLHEMPISDFGKNLSRNSLLLNYLQIYWRILVNQKHIFLGYYLSCPCNSESYRTFFGKILQKGHQNNYWKSCAKLFFFLIVMENDLWIVLNCHRNIIRWYLLLGSAIKLPLFKNGPFLLNEMFQRNIMKFEYFIKKKLHISETS